MAALAEVHDTELLRFQGQTLAQCQCAVKQVPPLKLQGWLSQWLKGLSKKMVPIVSAKPRASCVFPFELTQI